MSYGAFQDLALRLAPIAAGVANYCDHVEHNEVADRAAVLEAGSFLRDATAAFALDAGLAPLELYAERLGQIEERNVLARPGAYDGHRAALEAETWRDLQIVQIDHDRAYHPDVIGLAKDEQLRHYALHLAKIAGAFAEPAAESDLMRRRLPDALLFGIKLPTVMGVRLGEEPLPGRGASRSARAAAPATAR